MFRDGTRDKLSPVEKFSGFFILTKQNKEKIPQQLTREEGKYKMNKDFKHSIVFAKSADGNIYFGSVQFYQEEEPNWSTKKVLLFSAMRIYSDKPIELSELNKEELRPDIRAKRVDEVYIGNAKEIIEASDEAIDNIYDIVSW